MQETLNGFVARARAGDLEAYGRLVESTQAMAYGVALGVLCDHDGAQDAVQEAYLRAFRRLKDLEESGAFVVWLRRIVVTVALNFQRSRRTTLLRLDDVPAVPVLDEAESSWTEAQRRRLSAALLALTGQERRLCDLRYHAGWSSARLAQDAGVEEAVMRKRLQRVRDKLRKEMEMAEQREIRKGDLNPALPARIVELLARPKLTDLPENPVGKVLEQLRGVYAEFTDIDLPEILDLEEARGIAEKAIYIDPRELHRVDDRRILRYDLTLPLLRTLRFAGEPLRVWAAGKVYRDCDTDAMHLQAFHQAEVFWMDSAERLDPWLLSGKVLESVHRTLPGAAVKIMPTEYPMCREAWDLAVEDNGQWLEVLAWGIFTDEIVQSLGGDPARHSAAGVGYGLERFAMLRYGIDDARKIDVARVA